MRILYNLTGLFHGIALTLLAAGPAFGATYYVSAEGDDQRNGAAEGTAR